MTRMFNHSAVQLDCTYPHRTVDDLARESPQLSVCLEINHGLPCLHLYSDVYDGEALLTVFAVAKGELIVRVNSSDAGVEGSRSYTRSPLRSA